MTARSLGLRSILILLLAATTLVTLAIVGTGVLLVMVPQITQQNQIRVARATADAVERIENNLTSLADRISNAADAATLATGIQRDSILDSARGSVFSAVYLIDANGKLVADSINVAVNRTEADLVGSDFSYQPLYRSARTIRHAIWSDQFLSVVTGEVTIGLAIPSRQGDYVIMAELPVNVLLRISQTAVGSSDLALWIIDGTGDVIADTAARSGSRTNLAFSPFVAAALSGQPIPETLTHDGRRFQAAASLSQSLGWLFVSRVPTGFENQDIRVLLGVILATFGGSSVIGLILAPVWARALSGPLHAVMQRAREIAAGAAPREWPHGRIAEVNDLAQDLEMMARHLAARQSELTQLNEELEGRVATRTRELETSNQELSTALQILESTQDELVRVEKLAALGGLVAGVAHELNTPLGNGRLSLSTVSDNIADFRKHMKQGLRRSELENFLNELENGMTITERNIARASDLVTSFKRVAIDRTTSLRRKFALREVLDETILTLRPSLRLSTTTLSVDIRDEPELDSYPGELGQVLTNLISNAVTHAYPDGRGGTVWITTEIQRDRTIIRVVDDGIGMPPEIVERIFDPFFTTRMGAGGTGLGLSITHNAVTGILGGRIEVQSVVGKGTTFTLDIPLVAPSEAAKGA